MKTIYLISKNQDFLESVHKNLVYVTATQYRFRCISYQEWENMRSNVLFMENREEVIFLLDGSKEAYNIQGDWNQCFYFTEDRSIKREFIYKYQPVDAYIDQVSRQLKTENINDIRRGTKLVWVPLLDSLNDVMEAMLEDLYFQYNRGQTACIVELLPFMIERKKEKPWLWNEDMSISDFVANSREPISMQMDNGDAQMMWIKGAKHPIDLSMIKPAMLEWFVNGLENKEVTLVILSNQFESEWLRWFCEHGQYLWIPKISYVANKKSFDQLSEWIKLQNPLMMNIQSLQEVL